MALKRARAEIEEDSEIDERPIKRRKLLITNTKNEEQKIDDNASTKSANEEIQQNDKDCYLLVVDTEVNGWNNENCDKKSGTDPESRITQIAWTKYSDNGQKIETKSFYIQPDGWEMTKEAIEYTKITNEILQTKGIPVIEALEELNKDFEILQSNDGFIAAHKYVYDAAIIMNEIRRLPITDVKDPFEELMMKLGSSATKENNIIDTHALDLLEALNSKDAFVAARIKAGSRINKHLKWWPSKKWGPKLSCLHQVICGGDKHKRAHDAAVDVEMCAELIFAVNKKYNIDLLA